VIIRLLPLALAVSLAAADPVAPRPSLGLWLEPATGAVAVTATATGGAGAAMGLVTGDRIRAVGCTPVADLDGFVRALEALPRDGVIALVVERDGALLALSGTVPAQPRPRELALRGAALEDAVAALRTDLERDRLRNRLEDGLRLLAELQAGLPETAAAFKRLYPQGRFDIRISIDIVSDPTAPVQVPLAASATRAP
jgi:hypothetical protein